MLSVNLYLSEEINQTSIDESKSFVESLFNVNLCKVTIINQGTSLCITDPEGSCVSVGEDEHYVFYQITSNGIVSTDLLVHELAHAANLIVHRQAAIQSIPKEHICISEAIAYFAQLSFLKEHGSMHMKICALNAFLLTYLNILIYRYCIRYQIHIDAVNPQELIKDPEIHDFMISYPNPKEGEQIILMKIREVKNGKTVLSEIYQRFGIVIAIILLTNKTEMSAIIELMKNNSIEIDLETLLSQLGIPECLKIRGIDHYIEKYIRLEPKN
jgi:hypothetical protein